jgi:hypothetical protein
MPDPRTEQASALMMGFAERTGLTTQRPPRRYLWTDAFAVCNFLGLARLTGEQRYADLALRLVEQVHSTLGRHRVDDARTGWISGLGEREGQAHPTRGGLRIGKTLPERGPNESFDEGLEWDRDGQYFHYLIQWMHALDQVALSTARPQFNQWARELAEAAFAAFAHSPSPGAPLRLYWKMSIDLKRPLVASMGQHDPLDGYLTYSEIRATAASLPAGTGGPSLEGEIRRLGTMAARGTWATADPLGLGGLLIDAYRTDRLMRQGVLPDGRLLGLLLADALAGLESYATGPELRLPAEYRLAFRELGLAIGLHVSRLLWERAQGEPTQFPASPVVREGIRGLIGYAPVGNAIESFWSDPEHQRTSAWSEHRDINEVMLGTSLAPEGFLGASPR